MITRIGLVAGEIWEYLEGNEKAADLEVLISDLGKERDLVLMSLGWLAREGHVIVRGESPDYNVKLKKKVRQND